MLFVVKVQYKVVVSVFSLRQLPLLKTLRSQPSFIETHIRLTSLRRSSLLQAQLVSSVYTKHDIVGDCTKSGLNVSCTRYLLRQLQDFLTKGFKFCPCFRSQFLRLQCTYFVILAYLFSRYCASIHLISYSTYDGSQFA